MINKHIPKISEDTRLAAKKRPYHRPFFQVYGKLSRVTQGTGGTVGDAGSQFMVMSDRKVKEKIVRIGEHFLGIGLYLFVYKPKYRDLGGFNRKLGVMADEVETVMPEAVSVHSDGYKMVNYGMLGISLGA